MILNYYNIFQFILSIAPKNLLNKRNLSAGEKLNRPVSTGSQDYETNKSLYPLTQAIPKIEALAQTTGLATPMPVKCCLSKKYALQERLNI